MHAHACAHTPAPSNKRLSPQRMVKNVAYDRKVSWTSPLYSNQNQQKSHACPVVSARQSGFHVSPAPAPCEHIFALGFLCPEVSGVQADSQCLPHSGSVCKVQRGAEPPYPPARLIAAVSWGSWAVDLTKPFSPQVSGESNGKLNVHSTQCQQKLNKVLQVRASQGSHLHLITGMS